MAAGKRAGVQFKNGRKRAKSFLGDAGKPQNGLEVGVGNQVGMALNPVWAEREKGCKTLEPGKAARKDQDGNQEDESR